MHVPSLPGHPFDKLSNSIITLYPAKSWVQARASIIDSSVNVGWHRRGGVALLDATPKARSQPPNTICGI